MTMNFCSKICVIYFFHIFFNMIITSEAKEKSEHHHHRHNETRRQAFAKGGDIARQKCDEYTSQACNIHSYGRSLFNTGSYSKETIVGGIPALTKEFPHMGALGIRGAWICGCSLISESFAVTAAHCIYPNTYVRFGDLDLEDTRDDATAIQKEVIQHFVHPDYDSDRIFNDIALVRFHSLSQFTDHVRPICLNTLDNIPQRKLGVIGWGAIGENGPGSSNLLHTELDAQDPKLCESRYDYDDKIMVCAGYLPGGKDTCQGDSGGPLQLVATPTGCSVTIYSLVGIVSKGYGCARPNVPGVYTRVSYFIPWIESIVWK